MAGKPWYNNGDVEIQIDTSKGEIIPDGFNRGRLSLTDEQRQKKALKFRNSMLNRDDEQKQISSIKKSNSLKNTYSQKSDIEKQAIIDKRMVTIQNKSEEEKQEYRNKLSINSKGKNLGKEPWNKGLTKDTDDRIKDLANNLSKVNKDRYNNLKHIDPQYFINWRNKVSNSMKLNNSYGKSKAEEQLYTELCDTYGKDNVIRQYKDSRYPFDCDFYIKSEDLFIELNRHWTHGGHPFDKYNLNDICKLEDWELLAQTSHFYKNAIYVWTDLDVRKAEIAKKNNLNYKVIY